MNKYTAKLMFVWMLMITPALSGCWDVYEPERMYYVHGIGVDYKENQYEVYFQIIDFAKVAKSEQPVTDAVQAEVGYATGKSMNEALFKLYRSLDQRVYWGHLTYFIFSEDLIKKASINGAIDTFTRYRDTRYQIWVYFTNESLREVLLISPLLNKGITLSKLGDPQNSYSQESFIDPIDLRKLIIQLDEPSHEAIIPYITLRDNWETYKEVDTITFLSGAAVVTPDAFKGTFQGNDAKGLQWMSEETERGEVTVQAGDSQTNSSTVVLNKLKVKVIPIINQGDVQFDIHLKMNASVSGLHGETTKEKIHKAVVEQVKKEVMDTYNAALKKDIDIYRLSEYLYRQHIGVWKEQQQDGKIELTEGSIRNLTVELTNVSSGREDFKRTIEPLQSNK